MPELSNIQTYEKFNGSHYEPTLEHFCKVLKVIDLWNDEIKAAFDNFKWKADDDGYIFSSIMKLGHFSSEFPTVKIRSLIMVYTPAIDNTFEDNWICCELLIEAEELRNDDNGQFYNHTYGIVKKLIFEMYKVFKQTGIYFTNEAQDLNSSGAQDQLLPNLCMSTEK